MTTARSLSLTLTLSFGFYVNVLFKINLAFNDVFIHRQICKKQPAVLCALTLTNFYRSDAGTEKDQTFAEAQQGSSMDNSDLLK